MRARSFFFAACGVLAIACAYAIGSGKAEAQGQAPAFVAMQQIPDRGGNPSALVALSADGRWYWAATAWEPQTLVWHLGGNVEAGTVANTPLPLASVKRRLSGMAPDAREGH